MRMNLKITSDDIRGIRDCLEDILSRIHNKDINSNECGEGCLNYPNSIPYAYDFDFTNSDFLMCDDSDSDVISPFG